MEEKSFHGIGLKFLSLVTPNNFNELAKLLMGHSTKFRNKIPV